MSDSLLKSMLQNLSETERSQFVMEVFASLSAQEQERLKARLLNKSPLGQDSGQPAVPTRTSTYPQPKPKVTDFDVFTQSMSNQFESERKMNIRQILGCSGLILLALALVVGLSYLLKFASDLIKAGVPH